MPVSSDPYRQTATPFCVPAQSGIRLTEFCVHPDMSSPPSEVTFGLSPSYGIRTAYEAHDWFLLMMRSHDEFVVETHKAWEAPMLFLE